MTIPRKFRPKRNTVVGIALPKGGFVMVQEGLHGPRRAWRLCFRKDKRNTNVILSHKATEALYHCLKKINGEI